MVKAVRTGELHQSGADDSVVRLPLIPAWLKNIVVEIRTIEANEVIRAPEITNSNCMIVTNGTLLSYSVGRSGARQPIALYLPGDFIGLDILDFCSFDTISTLSRTTVAVISRAHLNSILLEQSQRYLDIWALTMLEAAIQKAWMFRLGRLDGAGRIAHFLCELNARLEFVGLSDNRGFDLKMRKRDIAEICSMTDVHASRVLRRLQNEQICSIASRRVKIADIQRLSAYGQFDGQYLHLQRRRAIFLPTENVSPSFA